MRYIGLGRVFPSLFVIMYLLIIALLRSDSAVFILRVEKKSYK